MKLAIIFGSSSNEHEVSIASASAVIKNLDKTKYDIRPIYLDKENNFYKWTKKVDDINTLKVGEYPKPLKKIANPFKYLKTCDLIWILIHGKNGEDGTIASICEFLNIKYLGNKVKPSIITMDKILTKIILEQNGIKTTNYLYFTKYNDEFIYQDKTITKLEMLKIITAKFNFPLFIKAASSGSSIGVFKVISKKDLALKIDEALQIDNRLLIEENIDGRELECAILEDNNQIYTSCIGEVITSSDFYNYNAKYNSRENNTIIPADLDLKIASQIKETAQKAFKILECHGYSRCDFFLKDNEIYLNEINTIPGFTTISMYPMLFEASGISYSELLNKLILNALK